MHPHWQLPTFCVSLFLTLMLLVTGASAYAQGRRPAGGIPQHVTLPSAAEHHVIANRVPGSSNASEVAELRASALSEVAKSLAQRQNEVRVLLRNHSDVLEADPKGELIVRREILAWSPSEEALAAARAAGLTVIRQARLDELNQVVVIFGVPDRLATGAALEQLRAIDPAGSYDFNHIYTKGSSGAAQPAVAAAPAAGQGYLSARVGLIDSGIDESHEVFATTKMRRWGCGDKPHPSLHGTAVAALMVGQSPQFHGVLTNATLYAADIYCDEATGGSAEHIASALAWMAREKVAVINVSLVGPPNQTLERLVAALVQRGHLLVAAVGNDGPAAPPLYPASYPGVVGVSAVDREGRCLPEAARGAHVMFAAPGSQMLAAAPGTPAFRQVRGTSFAAPIVAALLASTLPAPDKAQASIALATLAKLAKRPDPSVVSNETGYGIVGESYRRDPTALR